MNSFYAKYKINAVDAALFITQCTHTDNLINALEVVEDCEQYQQNIQDEFGAHYEDVILDCHNYLTQGTMQINSPFEETV